MSKTVVDNGSYYSFPKEPAYVEMKAGIYYPSWSDVEGFLLVQNKVKKEDLYEELGRKNNRRSDDIEIPRSKNIPRLPSNGHTNAKKVLDDPFVSDNYFPMEKYNPGLRKVEKGIQFFLNREDFFTDNGLDYKRSILFFGPPGTGKTWYIRNLSERMVESHNAIVIRVDTAENLDHLHGGLNDVNRTIKDRTKIIVIEELAEFCRDSHLRTKVLQLLDSTYFRNNVLFMVTTNEPESIPMNLIDRPSRLDVLAKVDGTENDEGFVDDWYKHITGRSFPDNEKSSEWFRDAINQLTPVYWAELFKFAELHEQNLSESWEEIISRKKLIEDHFQEQKSVGFSYQ